MQKRLLWFFICCIAILAVFSNPLIRLIKLALHHGYSSHIILVPLISIYLVWSARESIFASPHNSLSRAIQIGAPAALVLACALAFPSAIGLSTIDFVSVLAVLLLILAAFVGVFGTEAAWKAAFPFCMLAFMLPIPAPLLNKIIYFLQAQSAELTYSIFTMLHVPVLRDGFVMALPGATIEVATECSGINSSVALLILMILFAHETLTSNWRRIILVLLVIPLSILKNAIRIVTLTLLATKVDPGFLTGRLHHEGGFVFFLITLVLVYPVWKLLQRNDISAKPNASEQTVARSYSQAK